MHATRQRQHHADGRVRDVFGAVVGDIGHGDAALAGELVVHVVEADPAADDELAALETRESARGQADQVIQHHRVRILDLANQIILGAGVQRDDLGHVAEETALVFERFADEIRDDNLRALAHG